MTCRVCLKHNMFKPTLSLCRCLPIHEDCLLIQLLEHKDKIKVVKNEMNEISMIKCIRCSQFLFLNKLWKRQYNFTCMLNNFKIICPMMIVCMVYLIYLISSLLMDTGSVSQLIFLLNFIPSSLILPSDNNKQKILFYCYNIVLSGIQIYSS